MRLSMPTHLLTQKDRFKIDTDPHHLQIDIIHDYLSNRSYWAKGRSIEVIQKSIANSLCFGVYDEEQLVGFARVVSDYATFGWLCDVFILESHRGHGLGKWLVETILQHPDITNIRRLLLATRDAHELYRLSGFRELEHPEKLMERPNPSVIVPPLE
jgi:GNAT superfamily N-acetyltransferase